MSDKRSIDKQYLLETLRNFDKDVLSKKYNNSSVSKGDPGENGITPHIGENGHWFIGETDTNVFASGKDGKSITKISLDDNNNLTVTFSDGSTQNIGSLSINVEANFLTEGGFGNLRYYLGKLEYFDTATQAWVETSVTPDNVYIFNMMPQAMRAMSGMYDVDAGHYKLMFEEPADTVIDGQVACVVEKVIIRRKLGSDPENENDGTLVATITRPNFGTYKDKWYVDNFFSPNMGEEWYYKAFPVSTTGFANVQSDNSTRGMLAKDYYLFGYKIDQNESDPDTMVTYLEDNKKFKKASMDYTVDRFNYGTWENAFFMPRPCMLNTDGTVAYYLDPNDYELKEDGTPSDVANPDFDGNAMMEFPKIFWKITDNLDNTGTFLFSDKKVDNDFVCWSNIDANGNEILHFYTSIYNGSVHSGKLRSLSGYAPLVNNTRQQELDYAHSNNPEGVHIYDTDVFCDIQLITMLCVLISRSTNSKKAFGTGNNNTYVSTSNTGIKKTGTMDKKGMFWGDQTNKAGVKVFGREHTWGNIWKNCAGWINNKGTQKIKMTYGQSDGSMVNGYNITGDGYITIEDVTPSGTSGGYISLCKFTENGIIPKQASGSSTTKFCDGLWFNNSQVNYAIVGGYSSSGAPVGTFCSDLSSAVSYVNWGVGAGLSCKPSVETQSVS